MHVGFLISLDLFSLSGIAVPRFVGWALVGPQMLSILFLLSLFWLCSCMYGAAVLCGPEVSLLLWVSGLLACFSPGTHCGAQAHSECTESGSAVAPNLLLCFDFGYCLCSVFLVTSLNPSSPAL